MILNAEICPVFQTFYTEESAYIKLGGNVVRWIPEWREECRGEGMCIIRRKGKPWHTEV